MLPPEWQLDSPAQLWGFARYPLVIAMYASRREGVLRVCGGLVGLCGAIHFYLLGLMTATVGAILGGTRIALPALPPETPARIRRAWALFYAAGFLALALASWQGWISLFAATLCWASTCLFLLLRDRPLRLRLRQLEFAWLLFGFASHSYSQILISLTVIPIMTYRISTMSRRAPA